MTIKNARLKNMFKLSSKVTIYVPATVNTSKAIDNARQVDEVAETLSRLFGGATSTPEISL